ncbi:uncharacterized protein SPAPADRAFT_58534 [Spathaspora passalidarum NRRL Y-27907]|uniref:Uncharacterized protein n=1 Tax=Spathaspora passalidarum (strain NRRL Y-27907 / 11-Y1) TaxID=619300 RepID=G3AGH3_SPAPN|nr:uncharacterized protein SPAPADRAFT_58534 [Spathaspora passalidarum NRRL Y-27907]EGW35312.1 hypothetical protein SPAPADRAFT_58534 [Spathaspora passalidarum NRRL Y-27907]
MAIHELSTNVHDRTCALKPIIYMIMKISSFLYHMKLSSCSSRLSNYTIFRPTTF